MISHFQGIPIDNIKKMVPNFFDKRKHVLHYENSQLYLRLGLKLKKKSIQTITMVQTIC